MVYSRLLDPHLYLPALWDLRHDAGARAHWARMFRLQIEDMLRIVGERRGAAARAAAGEAIAPMLSFLDRLDPAELEHWPHAHSWTLLRDRLIAEGGVEDPYQEVKEEENAKALPGVGGALAALAAAPTRGERLRRAVGGVFAGNLFDLGSPLTAGAHRTQGTRFGEQRDAALGSAWLRDDRDALGALLQSSPAPRRVVILVDNAGPDFLLGVLPLGWLLAGDGSEVVLAANQSPSLNDVTASEALELLDRAARADPSLAALLAGGRLRVASTGTGSPGIDFRAVGPQFEAAAAAADLLVIVGQGRGLETNWRTRLDIPVLRLAAVKDTLVAAELGGSVYDLVCDLRLPGAGAPARPTP